MSYEDLEEARAKRAAKEKATASKGERGRKRKSAILEAGTLVPKGKTARASEVLVLGEDSAEPWRAPVARMY
jgi:hypothetical protein